MGATLGKAWSSKPQKRPTPGKIDYPKRNNCRPLHERLDHVALPAAHRPRPSCAVVGSADILRFFPLGAEIDSHARVWRINQAPTHHFEQWVGSRTHVRVVNHVMADAWNGQKVQRPGEFVFNNSDEFPRHLCKSSLCIMADNAYSPTMLRLTPNHRRALHPTCDHAPASTGLLAAAMALRVCDHVHLYGFFSECCKNSWLPDIRYKYYHTNASKWVCCSEGREAMDRELSGLRQHPRISVHYVPTPAPSRVVEPFEHCAVVGSAHSTKRWGWRIDMSDRVFRVDHAPAGGLFAEQVGVRTDVRTLGSSTLELILGRRPREAGVTPIPNRSAMRMCDNDTKCVFLAKYADRDRYNPYAHTLLSELPSVVTTSDNFTAHSLLWKAQFSRKPFKKLTLSGDLATTLYARTMCKHVSVYFVETTPNSSCCVRGSPYNYYTSARARDQRCCGIAREGNDEYEAWRALRRLHQVHVHDL